MALKDTLAKLQQQQADAAEWERDKPFKIAAWQQLVTSLFGEVRGCLVEHEAAGSMAFATKDISKTEEMLGKYQVATMSITAGPATVVLEPVGLMMMGILGSVEMRRQGRPSVPIWRVGTSDPNQPEQWVVPAIQPPARPLPARQAVRQGMRPQTPQQRVPLSKETLEAHLERLLA
jgi:hypothetical protein